MRTKTDRAANTDRMRNMGLIVTHPKVIRRKVISPMGINLTATRATAIRITTAMGNPRGMANNAHLAHHQLKHILGILAQRLTLRTARWVMVQATINMRAAITAPTPVQETPIGKTAHCEQRAARTNNKL
jgi:hypothetical protein